MVADEPKDFASSVVDLLNKPLKRRELSEAARCYVEQCHSWESAGERLEDIYLKLGEI